MTDPDRQTHFNTSFAVAISLRGERDVGLNQQDHLIFRMGTNRFSMGHTTKEDIDRLCEALQRLKTHCPYAT